MHDGHRLAVGDPAPPFELPGLVPGNPAWVPVALDATGSAATAVVVTAGGCPFVLAWHDRIQSVARGYGPRGVRVLQVVSNDAGDHPEDSPAALAGRVAAGAFAGPLLHDADQAVARAYGATATPEVFVVDRAGVLRYHGAPDADHDDEAQDAAWLRDALDDVLAGRDVRRPATPPAGCSVKWRVELRWWAGCPSHERAAALLADALAGLGRDEVPVARREVRTRDEARELGFPGSPTFVVGGRDLFPSTAPAALTCRVYAGDGRSGPLPPAADLADRLRDALARPWDLPGWVDPRRPTTETTGRTA